MGRGAGTEETSTPSTPQSLTLSESVSGRFRRIEAAPPANGDNSEFCSGPFSEDELCSLPDAVYLVHTPLVRGGSCTPQPTRTMADQRGRDLPLRVLEYQIGSITHSRHRRLRSS